VSGCSPGSWCRRQRDCGLALQEAGEPRANNA
jgi:hypothetical protein